MTRSVPVSTSTSTDPLPASMAAACEMVLLLLLAVPFKRVRVGGKGAADPVGQARNGTEGESGPMAVKINPYPSATGMPEQGPLGMLNERGVNAAILGPPNGPIGLRVSTRVQRTTDTM